MLDGIKVIEHATYMAAPGAGGILSDWGAEVIKIEPPQGDPIRNFFSTIGTDFQDNPVFDFDNRGKKSIVLDTSTPEGQAVLRDLASDADVFLTNVRPGGLQRAELDFANLIKINPKLVYCTLTGYGLEGPDADKPGFDVASFWSRAGVGHLTVPKGQDPFALRTAFGDHTTSMAAAAGICAALVKAQRTGQGQLVEASLLRAALFAMGSDFAIQLFFGRIGSTKSRHEQIQPLMNFFKTKDDSWICIVSRQGNVDWAPLCRVMDRADLIEDERYTTGKSRRANAAELVTIMDAEFGKYTKAEIAQRLDDESIAWAPVQTLAEVAKDPQVAAAGGITQVPSASGDGSSFSSPASPIRFPGADDGPKGPSPLMGEHSRDILGALGYDDAKIDGLFKGDIVR
ncbi:MAG: CoA transferase [Hyphomonadaceae bacterium]|nr:CoA transferase [Hyphomonadaceae bacterium]